ncbi:MAG TPA: diacylglycerol kinase family protein [Gemmatimonadaceae bacterium]|nr:diacylglycerol kinase family protein [Gemmatimonadaceae bacterium]
MPHRVAVIVNPASGRGSGARALPAIRAAYAAVGVSEVRLTSAKGGEEAEARKALDDGFDTIVACGGDGTWGNVANAIIAADAGRDVRLALLATGTGNDFAKTVGSPARDFPATARLSVEGGDVAVDVGRIEGRHFLNVSGFGFDIAVLEDIERISWLRGDMLYLYSAMRQLFRYGGVDIAITTPRKRREPRHHLMLIVANARHFGGSFKIAPGASLTDGKLDAISILDAAPLARMRLFAAATKGTHVMAPEVLIEQSPGFTLEFAAPPSFETDGEYHRASSTRIQIDCVPGAVRVVTRGIE